MKNQKAFLSLLALTLGFWSLTAKAESNSFFTSGNSSCYSSNQLVVAKRDASDSAKSKCIEEGFEKVKRISDYDIEYSCGHCITYHNPEGRCIPQVGAEFHCSR